MLFSIIKEHFIEIMEDEMLQLPKRWDGKDFYKTLHKLYKDYEDILSLYMKKKEVNKVKTITRNILKIIEAYNDGFPADAFKILSDKVMPKLMSEPLKVYPKNGGSNSRYTENDPLQLYRARNIQSNTTLNRGYIFHTPYSLRSKIATCRYSISGFPCLYLATSLELCCEESKISSFNDLRIASRFQINRRLDPGILSIEVIEMGVKPSDFVYFYKVKQSHCVNDFSNRDIEDKPFNNKYFNEIDLLSNQIKSQYIYWYPLVAACSFIRVSKSDPFASEYIIPQLLMQWIRKNNSETKLMGIRYFSCASKKASDMGLNYVFPVSSTPCFEDDRFCNILSQSFRFTEPHYVNEYGTLSNCEEKLKRDRVLKRVWE